MRQQVEQRLRELRAELDAGQRMLADLDARQADLQTTMLRISGAIQVLEELLDTPKVAVASDGQGAITLEAETTELPRS